MLVIHITYTRIVEFSSGIEKSDICLLIAERQTVTSSSEGWKDTDLGWLPNKGSHRDTQFSNNLLKKLILFICWFTGCKQITFSQGLYTGMGEPLSVSGKCFIASAIPD